MTNSEILTQLKNRLERLADALEDCSHIDEQDIMKAILLARGSINRFCESTLHEERFLVAKVGRR